jgi:hypothetical protein
MDQYKRDTPSSGSGRIRELQEQIDELKKSWPAHSTPASMLLRLEELEEELEKALETSEG